MPDVEFNQMVANGDYTISELIGCFDVEQWFLEHKISYFRRKEFEASRKVKWSAYVDTLSISIITFWVSRYYQQVIWS